jgi:arginyl-tRNA synthetase
MNIFELYKIEIKKIIIKYKDQLNLLNELNFNGVQVETPPDKFNCDLSTNAPMVIGKQNKISPIDLAKKIGDILLIEIKDFKKVELAGPGFLNITLSEIALSKHIKDILSKPKNYGSYNNNKNYNIEFVSANPTGPMHVGHCRGAIYGDVLSNLLKFNKNKVTKEYYINDYGGQIKNFTKSVYLRIREIKFDERFIDSKNLYPGQYIVDIAKKIMKENPDLNLDSFDNIYELIKLKSLECSMILIKDDLQKLGITHDNFISESELVKEDLVNKTVETLKKKKLVEDGYLDPPKNEENKEWKKTKRLIFKSTLFGDDSDRALQKNDGSWTYFANDVAYHANKVSRNYDFLINVLGADHTGYIKRISSAVKALSNDKIKLSCRVCQLVKLFKNGKPFKMSKRAGDFISANDLLKEVNKDSIRFMMLNRSNDVELDFDFDKIIEKSKENPVFYVQYCFARINSLYRTLKINPDEIFNNELSNFQINYYEKKILRKIFDWPKIIEVSANKYEPHRIPFYLYELATLFHSYWSKGNDVESFRFINDGKIRNNNTLVIIKLVQVVIENGMNILGVSLPRKM